MTLAQLSALLAVIETRSFSSAASRLGVTQSAVSHALSDLETELGVILLVRGRRGVTPTEIGRRVAIQAREMQARADAIYQEAASELGLTVGKVRIGSFASVTSGFLPAVLRRFHQRYPQIELVLLEGSDDEVLDWLTACTIDLGVVTLPCDSFDRVPIAHDEWVALVPANHPLAGCGAIPLAGLCDDPFIMSQAGCERIIRQMFSERNLEPRAHFGVMSMTTIVSMVSEGMGVSIVPTLALPQSSDVRRAVVARPLQPRSYRRLAIARASEGTPAPAIAAFLAEVTRSADHAAQAEPAEPDNPPSTAPADLVLPPHARRKRLGA